MRVVVGNARVQALFDGSVARGAIVEKEYLSGGLILGRFQEPFRGGAFGIIRATLAAGGKSNEEKQNPRPDFHYSLPSSSWGMPHPPFPDIGDFRTVSRAGENAIAPGNRPGFFPNA
jgi:hypothetical protein